MTDLEGIKTRVVDDGFTRHVCVTYLGHTMQLRCDRCTPLDVVENSCYRLACCVSTPPPKMLTSFMRWLATTCDDAAIDETVTEC